MAAPITTVVTPTSGYWALWHHAFQTQNTQWLSVFESRIFSGNFFLGLQASSTHIYDAQIPPGADIISATQRVTARFTSGAGAVNIPINTHDRETHEGRPLLLPFEPYEGWRGADFDQNDVDLLDNTAGTIIQVSGGVSNSNWILRQITAPGATLPNRERIGSLFTHPNVANDTIGSAIWQMFRTGNPTGSLRVRVHNVTTDQDGRTIPDESTTLATSDDVLASTVPVGPASSPIQFLFTGADQIDLVAGTQYALVLDADYTANNADHITCRAQRQFLSLGSSLHYGEGLGGDWQNYPGSTDIFQVVQTGAELTTDVIWSPPQFIANTNYTSPDISSVVQAQINQDWYTQDSGIMIWQQVPGSGNNNRVWWSSQSATMQPQLTVTYRPRRIFVVP